MDIIERLLADGLDHERRQNSHRRPPEGRSPSRLQMAACWLTELALHEPQWTRDDLIELVDFALRGAAEDLAEEERAAAEAVIQ